MLKEKYVKEYIMYKISNVTGLGLSQFFQLSFNVKLTRLSPFICLRVYLYLLGFLYFSLKPEFPESCNDEIQVSI